MAKKSKKENRIAKAKAIVKKINNDLIDASFNAIETTVKTGEKWQKLTAKLIKKAEPLSKQQINMFVDTAENIKGQLETSTDRLKDLVGYDPKMIKKAKKKVAKNPLAKKADNVATKLKKEVEENPLVIKAEKMTAKLKMQISETIEDVKDIVEDYTEDPKKSTPKKKKKTKKAAPKKVVAKKSTVKNDLKMIKGIGPKMEVVLNDAGISSFETLSKKTEKDIEKVLTNAGMNSRMFDFSTWGTQAKKAI